MKCCQVFCSSGLTQVWPCQRSVLIAGAAGPAGALREFDHFYFIQSSPAPALLKLNCRGEVRVLSEKITVFISCPGRPCSPPATPGHLEELFWSGALAEIRSYGPVDLWPALYSTSLSLLIRWLTDNNTANRQVWRGGGEGGRVSNVEPLHITCCPHQRDRGFIQSWLFQWCSIFIICKYIPSQSQICECSILTPRWELSTGRWFSPSYPGSATTTATTTGQPGSHQGWISTSL